jgi:hypothetical protein
MTRELFKSGLTRRTLLILLYGTLLIAPIDMFLYLYVGASYLTVPLFGMVAAPALFVTLITFTEIARYYGKPLTAQEVFIIYNLLGVSISTIFFIGFIYQGYFRVCPIVKEILDPYSGRSLYELLPSWYSPPESSFAARTFLDPGWFPIIAVGLGFFICYVISEVGLGLLLSYMYVEVEELPFPTANVDASAIMVLAERELTRTRIFSFSAIIGIVWSLITFGTPSVIGGSLGIRTGPLTFVDLTPWLNRYIQGPVFGVTFEIFPYTFGWIWLNPAPVVSMFIASYAIWFFGNIFALRASLDIFKDFQQEYRPGMTIDLLMWRSWLWIWASFLLGAGLGVALTAIIKSRKYLLSSFKSMARIKRGGISGYPPLWVILLAWLGGGMGAVALVQITLPSFPIWASIVFTLLLPFINASINARGRGEVGIGISLPYMKESMILASGYKGFDAWLSHAYYWGWGMGNNAASYVYVSKIAKITQTRPLDYFKGLLIILPVVWIVSFVITSLFWRIAPIPSEVFGLSIKRWPQQILEQAFIALNYERVYRPTLIGAGFIIFAALYAVRSIIPIPYLDVMGLLAGLSIPPYYSNALLLGYIIGNFVIRKRVGDEWWKNYRLTVLAGLSAGYGIVAVIMGCVTLIARALWYTQTIY